MRVLLIAEECNPQWVSVPLEGWSHARAIASLVDAHLVTQVRNRQAILHAGLAEGRDFTAIDTEAIAHHIYQLATLLRGGNNRAWTTLGGLTSLSYPYFEHRIWKQFGHRIRAREFDVVHRLTPLSPAHPSLLASRCQAAGVPFVIGPINGGVPWPAGFDSVRRREGEWLSYARELHRLVPGYLATRRHAAAIIVGSRVMWTQVPRSYRKRCVYIPENAIDPARFTRRRTRRAELPLKAVFVGRLVPLKAVDLFLEAAAPFVRENKLSMEIIGDGPEMPALKHLVTREGLESGVNLCGWVPHEQLQDRLIDADIFAFPSIRDFGGGAVLEAMAVGLAPVVMDYGGPADLVTPDSGFLIPMDLPREVVCRTRAVLEDLTRRPELVDEKATQAYRRARTQFTWEAKAKQVVEVYRWVLEPSSAKPDFGMPLPDLPQNIRAEEAP